MVGDLATSSPEIKEEAPDSIDQVLAAIGQASGPEPVGMNPTNQVELASSTKTKSHHETPVVLRSGGGLSICKTKTKSPRRKTQ